MTFLAIQGTHLERKPAKNQIWTHHFPPSIIQQGLLEGGRIDSYIPKILSNPSVRNALLIFIELLVQLQNKSNLVTKGSFSAIRW